MKMKIWYYPMIITGFLMLLCNNSYTQKIKYRSNVEKMIATDDLEAIKKYAKKSINDIDKVENTALMWAVIYNKIDIVNYLLEQKADPNIGKPIGEWGKKYLIKQGIENVDYYNTPLFIAVSHNIDKYPSKLLIVESLLAAGANPNAFDHNYSSALLSSVGYHNECIKILLEKGAKINYIKPTLRQSEAGGDIYQFLFWGSQWSDFKYETIDLLEEHGLNLEGIIINLVSDYIFTEYKLPRYGKDKLVRHLNFITYLLNKNYDNIRVFEFLSIIEYSLYEPAVNIFVVQPKKEEVSFFVDFFNAVWKYKKDELIEIFKDGTFESKVNNSPNKNAGKFHQTYKSFLLKLNTSIINSDKEWLDLYGFKLE